MTDAFGQLAADLEKYFGLGPLFAKLDEDEEAPASRGVRQAQQALNSSPAAFGSNVSMAPATSSRKAGAAKDKPPKMAASGIGRRSGGPVSTATSGLPTTVTSVLAASGPASVGVFGTALAIFSAWEATGNGQGRAQGALQDSGGHSQPAVSSMAVGGLPLGLAKPFDDEEKKKGGGGGGGRPEAAQSSTKSPRQDLPGSLSIAAKAAAARAAVASGAQPAVFKVISTPSSKGSAKALMEYLGRREGEDGEKHNIEVQTEDGRTLRDRADRESYLSEFTEQFREPFTNTNFVEVEMSISADTSDEALHSALNDAFGSKPFLYSRRGETVRIFGCTDGKAQVLNKELAAAKAGEKRAGGIERLETGLANAMEKAGVPAAAKVLAAVGSERSAQYFLQKFMRNNRNLLDHAGNQVKVAKRADKSAARVYESWKPMLQTREVRNAFHLLFSARAGTNPDAVIAAAKATLDTQAPGHKFALAYHPETSHVHVHAMVAAVSSSGERLAFRKADLHAWRETFAEKMRENGVEMVATRRFDMGASRSYNMRHAGAVERARSDPRYTVSSKTAARVENKRAAVLESATLVANGAAIARGWYQTAAVLHGAGAPPSAIETANRYAATVLSFDGARMSTPFGPGRTENQGKTTTKDRASQVVNSTPFMQRPEWKAIEKKIGEIAMAQTPLEMRERMHDVNSSLDKMRQTLPAQEQVKFDEFREKLNDQMYDRLAETRQPQRPEKPEGTQQGEERQMRERDVQAKLEPQQASSKGADANQSAQAKTAAKNKAKAKDAEQQDKKTQRSQDNEYDR